MLKICSVCSLNKTSREKVTFKCVIFQEWHMLLTHTNMSPLESPSCEKSQSASSSLLNETFSSCRAIKFSDLNSQNPQKASKRHQANIWYVNKPRGCKYNLRKCIVFLVVCFPWLLFIAIPVTLVAVSDASLDNNMHTLIWQMCRVLEHTHCMQVKLGVFLFFPFFFLVFSRL